MEGPPSAVERRILPNQSIIWDTGGMDVRTAGKGPTVRQHIRLIPFELRAYCGERSG